MEVADDLLIYTEPDKKEFFVSGFSEFVAG